MPEGAAAGPILVTGADGFVGRHLIATLKARWPATPVLTPGFDVRDSAACGDAVRAARPASCIHLAAISSVSQAAAAEAEAWQVNLHGTLNLAYAILEHAPRCRMVLVSSADAYGGSFRGGVAVDEAMPLAPMNLYGATKAAADLALGSLAVTHGLAAVRLRPFNHTGAGQSAGFVIASFARQIALIEAGLQPPVLRVGRLDTARDFLDVRDVCAAYAACLERQDPLPAGTIINIASGVPRRIGDILGDLLAMSSAAITVEAEAARIRDTDILIAIGNAGAARALLGWAPAIAWEQTLATVLDDWRQRVVAA